MHHTSTDTQAVDCFCDVERAAADQQRRISTHRTSVGHVIYYRCYCGLPRLTVWRWTCHRAQAA